MTGERIFLDTNIMIYAHSAQDLNKKQIVQHFILANKYIISTHVIDEFYNTLDRKLKLPLAEIDRIINLVLDYYPVVPIHDYTDKAALHLHEKYGYHFFDCLMLASALEYGCNYIITEDMHHGQLIEGSLTILNPFML